MTDTAIVTEQTIVQPLPPAGGDMVVIAKSASEMEVAQKSLVGWVDNRITGLLQELTEAETNLELAKKSKWRTAPWKKAVDDVNGRVVYYEKMKEALLAGYVIIPDLPAGLIAVRTTEKQPAHKTHKAGYSNMFLPSAKTDSPPVGEGAYVSPEINYDRGSDTTTENDRKVTRHWAMAESFQGVDFPMTLVKPQILEETNRAMALNVFDEIGILPAGLTRRQMLKGVDPIVLGRIVRTEGKQRIACAFLITWWISTATL